MPDNRRLYQKHLSLTTNRTTLYKSHMSDSALLDKIARELSGKLVRDLTVAVAVSGGADSVFLLRALHHWHKTHSGDGKLVAVHVNHQLRGKASDQDRQFVENLCRVLEVNSEFETVEPQLESSNHGKGLESSLRDLRYAAITKVASRCGARYVATGHNQNDQVETVLFRILRGTGIDGLKGIPQHRPLTESITVVRPLLRYTREEILSELEALRQDYREDETNASHQFTRNQIRHATLPYLREQFDFDIDQSLLNLSARATEQADLIRSLADPVFDSAFSVEPGSISVDSKLASSQNPELLKHCLRRAWTEAGFPTTDMTARKWIQLSELLLAENSDDINQHQFPGNVSVARDGSHIRISNGGSEIPRQ